MPNPRQKLQGIQHNQSFDDDSIQGMFFEAITLEQCSLVRTEFNHCSGSYLSFKDCTIRDPSFRSCGDWDHISLINTTVEKVEEPLDVSVFSRIEGSTLRDVIIIGRRQQDHAPLALINSTISGRLANFTIAENQSQNQLLGCDLRDCAVYNVRFLGIPVDRCQLPNSVHSLVLNNWSDLADEVFSKAMFTFKNPAATTTEKTAASIVMDEIQLDAGTFHSAHGTQRLGAKKLNLSHDRGARLVSELLDTTVPVEIANAIRAIYAPWL